MRTTSMERRGGGSTWQRNDTTSGQKTSDPRRLHSLPHDATSDQHNLKGFSELNPQTGSFHNRLWRTIQDLASGGKVISTLIEMTVISRDKIFIMSIALLGVAGDPTKV